MTDRRMLGIDLGNRRVGVAVSDPSGRIATPVTTLTRRVGKRPPYADLRRLADELGIEGVVVGLPLAPSGDETAWCGEVRAFGEGLRRRLEVPVYYQDERFTSARAERGIRAMGLPKAKREEKGRVDAAAAALILQAWLDASVPETSER
jgi:putative Holliday junction resolvase